MVFVKNILVFLLAVILTIFVNAGTVKSYPNPNRCGINQTMIRGECRNVLRPAVWCKQNEKIIKGECRPVSGKRK